MNLKIGYFYPQDLNLYGDTGNIEILVSRAKQRNIEAQVELIDSQTDLTKEMMESFNLVFMGGGPDSGQKSMYEDLLHKKGPLLKEYVENEGVALFICGSYQLLGHYYKAADGKELQGLGIFDLYTEHFGHHRPRSVGNIVCKLSEELLQDEVFKAVNHIGDKIVGFENHGGQTFLGENIRPFATAVFGRGNNTDDDTEGAHYKNAFGTYFHGPVLSKNPHIADYLLAKSLGLEKLSNLDDNVISKAHSALLEKYK